MTKLSLAALSLRNAAVTKVPYIAADGSDTGVVLHVQSEAHADVQRRLMEIGTARRKRDQERAADPKAVTPVQEDVDDINRMTACKLVGWDGVEDPWSEDAALSLVASNSEIADLVNTTAKKAARFTKSSLKV